MKPTFTLQCPVCEQPEAFTYAARWTPAGLEVVLLDKACLCNPSGAREKGRRHVSTRTRKHNKPQTKG
jgi:hypothetical protein